MLGRRAETCTAHRADNQWCSRLAAEHVTELGSLVEDLVEADSHEVHEHQFDHWTQPADGCPNGSADKGRLGDRGVHDTITKLAPQAFGDSQWAAPGVHLAFGPAATRNILAHEDDRWVAFH